MRKCKKIVKKKKKSFPYHFQKHNKTLENNFMVQKYFLPNQTQPKLSNLITWDVLKISCINTQNRELGLKHSFLNVVTKLFFSFFFLNNFYTQFVAIKHQKLWPKLLGSKTLGTYVLELQFVICWQTMIKT